MKLKKGQVQTQIFVYAIALIVVSLVLIYGYQAIQGFIKRSDEVAMIQFRTELYNAVKQQSSEHGSVIKKELMLPKGFNKIIIVDINRNSQDVVEYVNADGVNFDSEYPIVYDSWSSGVKNNLFLIGDSKVEPFFLGDEDDEDSYIFFQGIEPIILKAPDRILELKLSGKAGKTIVEKWPE